MPRPCKRRRICAEPACECFGPKETAAAGQQAVIMTLDEFESIRLIDFKGLTQEQCAEQMNVARTTVQAIYTAARSKLAECLVLGKELNIRGGDYVLCNGNEAYCGCRHDCRHHCHETMNSETEKEAPGRNDRRCGNEENNE